MKQYVIDELRPADHEKIRSYLDQNFGSSGIEGVYWIPLDREILTRVQVEHEECQPFYFAIDLEPSLVACELLVRTRNRVRCDCIGYATEDQLAWIIQFVDRILDELAIIV